VRSSRWRSAVGRFLGFGLVPALSLASSIVLLPLVAHRFGPLGWSSISVGTAVGAYAGVIIGLSWPITGPHRVARANAEERRAIYWLSLRSRTLVFVCALLPVAVVAGLLTATGPYMVATILVAVGISLNGFTAAWYFAGTGSPWLLVRNEALIRCGNYLLIILALSLGAPFWSYGAAIVASGLLMLIVNWFTIMGGPSLRFPSGSVPREPLSEQISGGAARFANSAFSTLTPVLFALAHPAGLSAFAALDQLQKAANNGLGAFPQALVGFVSRLSGAPLLHRLRLVVVAGCFCAIVGSLVFAFVGSKLIRLLFRGKVDPDFAVIVLVGVSIAMFFLGQVLQQVVLVPAGMVAKSYVVMASVSLSGIPVFIGVSRVFGVTGGVAVVASVATMIALLYLLLAARGMRKLRAGG